MKKLLGLMICLCALFALSVGATGCKKPEVKKVTPVTPPTADKKVDDKKVDDKKVDDKMVDDKKVDHKKVDDKKVDDKKVDDKKVDDKKVDDKKVDDKKANDKKADVKIKAHDGDVSVTKKGDTKVTVELTEKAPENLTLKAWAKDVDAKVLTGKGMIKKGETSGDVVITTVDAPDTISEVTIEIAPTDKTNAAMLKLKTKVKAK
jgi:hypothetical protein